MMKRAIAVSVLGMLVCCGAAAQETDSVVAFLVDQQVKVPDLAAPKAAPARASEVLSTALEAVLQNPRVCCEKDSALEDVLLNERLSLKELGAKVRGRHRMSNGETIFVNARLLPQGSILPEVILRPLMAKRRLLMEWDSTLYVIYGAVFNETRYYSGKREYAITKLLLLDPRYADERREAAFQRFTDDWAAVQGIMELGITR